MKECCGKEMIETKKGYYCAYCGKQVLNKTQVKTESYAERIKRINADNFDLANNAVL